MLTTFHSAGWSAGIAADLDTAERAVFFTALSCLPPRRVGVDEFSRLWLSLAALKHRQVALTVALPRPSLAHPATLRNDYAAAQLAAIGATVFLVDPSRLLHAKTYLIDARLAWIGSGNTTAAAAHHNREAWIRTDDARAVAGLAGFVAALTEPGA